MNSTLSASEMFLGGAYEIPQYVLACLPVIAIIGAIPTQADLCCYYLDKEYFARGTKSIPFRPFGLHAMKLEPTDSQLKCFSESYYIFLGWAMGISKIIARQRCNDWPYIPISLLWTIPVIYKRAVHGQLVFKDVAVELNDFFLKQNERIIQVVPLKPHELIKKRMRVAITAFLSIALFGTNSTFERRSNLKGNWIVHVWFCFCGVVVAILLLSFCLLSDVRIWWVQILGKGCDNSD
ncbi:988_t:CDS:2, partial [Gigaspora rosea]